MSEHSRLLWRCRRGMQELDILLQRFVDRHYDQLSPEEKCAFDKLLDQADPDIQALLSGKSDSHAGAFGRIISLLRSTRSGLES